MHLGRSHNFVVNLYLSLLIYHAHIQAHIYLGIRLYSTTKKNLDKLLTRQKLLLEFMLNLKNKSAKVRFKNLQLIAVCGMYVYEIILSVAESSIGLNKS